MIRTRPAFAPRLGAFVFVLAMAFLGACSKDDPVEPLPPLTVVPDFSLQDVNPNSITSGQQVSPRSQLGRVSAWYFGHST